MTAPSNNREAKLESRIDKVINQSIGAAKNMAKMPLPKSFEEVLRDRKREKRLEQIAPSTGYPDLDRIIKGFIPGHLYTLTGLENVGKTASACNFAYSVADQGKRVLYFALEPGNTLVDYIASIRTGKPFKELNEQDISSPCENIDIYGSGDINSVDQLVQVIRDLDRYDLIIIDHLGYFVQGTSNYVQEQSNIIKKLAHLTKLKNCAIMMIAHVRKAPPGKKNYVPTSDDISGSGAFKQDSTEVLIITRKKDESRDGGLVYLDIGELYVTKTKCGPNGSVNVEFTPGGAKLNLFSQYYNDPEMYSFKSNFKEKVKEEVSLDKDEEDIVPW